MSDNYKPSWDDTTEAPKAASSDVPKWEDTTEQEPKTSLLEAAKTFGLEGASRGFDDELGGGLEALGQVVGIKGLGAPTISETELQSPNGLDLDKLLNAYRTARDRRRNIKEEQRKDRPGTALAANVVGGLVPIPGSNPILEGAAAGLGSGSSDLTKGEVGGALLETGLGAGIGYGANKLIKAAPTGAMVGAGAGGIIGAGDAIADGADGEEIINRALTGTLIGTGVGAGGGALLKAGGNLINKIGNKVAASTGLQQGFKEGMLGNDITSKQFGDQVQGNIDNLTDEVVNPILGQKHAEFKFQKEAKDLFEKQQKETVTKFQNEIDDLMKVGKEFEESAVAQHTTDKQLHYDKLSNLTNKIADEFDTKFKTIENKIGKDIEAVYTQAGDKYNTPINMVDVIEGFRSQIPADKITPKMQKTFDLTNGDVSLKDSKQLRDLFWSLKNDSDSNIRQAAREAYQVYNAKAQADLTAANPALGEALKLNNSKYGAISKVRDNYIDYKDQVESGVHGVLRKFNKAEMTPSTEEQVFAKSQSKSEIENLLNTLKQADPNLADDLQSQGQGLAQQLQAVKASKPAPVPNPNAERLTQLQTMMEQAKANKFVPPVQETKFNQFGDEPLNVAQKFLNYLEKGQGEKEGLALKAEMDSFFKDLTSTKGEEFANTVKDQMGKLSDQYKIYTPELKLSDVFSKAGLGRTALKTSAVIGNKVGQGVKAVVDAPIVKKAALISTDMKNYLTPNVVQRLRNSNDSISQNLANMIENIQKMPKDKQNAAIFALAQNPVYRNKLNVENEDKR